MAMTQPNDDRRLVSIETQGGIIPAQSEWKLMREMAAQLVPTGFLPSDIDTPEKAVAVILKGRELNVPPMYALSNIAIVKGKPTVSAEMMLALIYRDHGKRAIRVKASTDDACTVEYRLEGWGDTSSYTFTMDQAKKAGLIKSGPWTQYPAAMLRARCISAVARMAFPESIAGMYVPGELGEEVNVSDDGEVVRAAYRNVDHDTGEITEPRQDRQDRSHEPIDAEVVETPPQAHAGTWEEENRRLHAIANSAGLDHAKLKVWLIAAALGKGKEITSTKDASPEALRNLGDRIERDPAKVEKQATDALMNPAVYELYAQGEAEKALGKQAEIEMEDEGEDE